MHGQERKGQVNEQFSKIIDVPAVEQNPVSDQFFWLSIQKSMLIHVGRKMKKDTKPKHACAQSH